MNRDGFCFAKDVYAGVESFASGNTLFVGIILLRGMLLLFANNSF